MSPRVRAALAVAALLPLALAACGRRGPPVAPERRLPAPTQDLAASLVAGGVRLEWTLPRLRADRSPIRALGRAEVYRRLEAPGDTAPPRPAILAFGGLFGEPGAIAGFDRVADIILAEPGPAEVRGTRVGYTDTRDVEVGRRYTYVVVAVDDQGRTSPPSNRVTVVVVAAPRPPTALRVDPGDREVRLAWEPPATLEDGSPLPEPPLYDVFRTAAPDAAPGAPLNPEPLARPGFVDLGVQNDATYYYAVRARLGPRGPTSGPSEVVAATPEDRTPPAAPRGLVAVPAARAVRLAWEGVAAPDLAGYHVYRSATAGRDRTRLTREPHAATTFTDDTVERGRTYYYVVTAVDRARRANESVPSTEASTTVP